MVQSQASPVDVLVLHPERGNISEDARTQCYLSGRIIENQINTKVLTEGTKVTIVICTKKYSMQKYTNTASLCFTLIVFSL